MNLSKSTKLTRVANSAVAATTDVTSSVLDMSGFDGVMFFAMLGDVTSGSVLQLTVKQNTANSTSSPTPTAITGGATTSVTAGASNYDNGVLMVDVFRPQNRYVFAVLSRGTQNAVVDGIIAIQYMASHRPTIQDATTILQTAFAVGS